MKYDIKVAEDAVVRVEADDLDEAILKAQEFYKTQVGSKNYDQINFDYETGLQNNKMRGLLGLAEKRVGGREIEKEQVLLNYVGPEGFTYNTKMDLALTPIGQKRLAEKGLFAEQDLSEKNIVIDESGFSSGDFADLSGLAGPIFGAIAAMSPHLRAVSVLQKFLGPRMGRMLAAGVGTAAGKGVEEIYEEAEGIQRQDSQELQRLLTTEFAIGSGGQALGELVGLGYAAFFGKKAAVDVIRDAYVISRGYDMTDVLKLDQKLGRIATEKDIEKAFKAGDIEYLGTEAAVSMGLLGKSIPGRTQAMGETIAGRRAREQGLIDYNNSMKGQLYKLLEKKRAAVQEYSQFQGTGAAAGEITAAKRRLETVENELSNQLKKMFVDMSQQTAGFNSSIMTAPNTAALGASVQNTIRDSYKSMINNFRSDYDTAFSRIRNIANEIGLEDSELRIPLQNLKDFIDNKLNVMNPTLKYRTDSVSIDILKGIAKEIDEGGEFANGATLSQLIEMRSDLVDIMLAAGVQGGGKSGALVENIIKQVDQAILDAPDNILIKSSKLKNTVGEGITNPEDKEIIKRAVKDLKDINAKYFADMKPFNQAITQKIVSEASIFGNNADDIYKHIILKNNSSAIDTILKAMERGGPRIVDDFVGPPMSKKIAADQLRIDLTRRLFADAVEVATDPVTGVFNPSKYVKNIQSYGATLRPLLKDNYDNMMKTLSAFNSYSPKLGPDEMLKLVEKLRMPLQGPGATENVLSQNLRVFADAIEAKAKASDSLLKIQQSKVLQNVENATPETITQVVFRPNSAEAINTVRNQISEEAFENIREEALEELLKKSISPGGTDITDLFRPGNFQRALDSYGEETIEAMFGKDLAQAFKGYSRALDRTVAGAKKEGAGGIVAATLAAGFFNLNILPSVIALTVAKTFFSQPKIVSLMARTDKSAMGQVLDAFEKALRLAGVRSLVDLGEQTEEQVSAQLEEQNILPNNLLESARSAIDNFSVPASLDLDLPNITASIPAPRTRSVGPTLLPNPQDQELAERLS